MQHRTHRRVRLAGLATATALLATACSSSGGAGSTADSKAPTTAAAAAAGVCGTTDKTTLTVGLFGTFGFKENGLYDAYKKVCPNITIKEDVVEQSADYWTRLKTRLASGSGLDDVQAIEIGFVADVVQNHADQFVNFNTVPNAAAIKSEFYPWKWPAGDRRSDGAITVGLGTDIGPEAICYRQRPAQEGRACRRIPQTLAAKWTTWEDFIDFGKQYEASSDEAVRLALRRQRGQHLLHRGLPGRRGVRQRPGRAPTSRTATACRTPGSTRPTAAAGRHHRRSCSSSARRGTRRSPAARSRRSPAPPG